ncbi:2,5-didehydrogluconate reductase B [Deinococcus indicus]|uniref:2,5-didehydrogluconate reductase B n=1 Tax=Deinococcus indicus TaxID=223556 RepID=A0A246BH84_9DEIO|nr:2,5-didehydrogluconate reductase DkgB [Deinococcus indicus]OWL94540.1 2,5-didehydrogluconate reductase B [Deinococcus indicus]GHG22966.1 2,5-diketo-D-gluconate reductase B [Deinococcus indicus]
MSTDKFGSVPKFGLGTFRLKDQVVMDSVRAALDLGYRAIDTAQGYGNEAEIGEVLAESGIHRDELFLTTKIKPDNYSRSSLVASLQDSVEKLGVEAVDLTLIHWPVPNGPVKPEEYLKALADGLDQGLTRQIGVSNFNIEGLKQARAILGDVPIATNQVEIHPYLQNRRLAEFARGEGIHLTSYMTLAVGKVMDDPVMQDIARAHRATPAQVALAWALTQEYSVIPSSTKRKNLQSNLGALTLRLTDEDMTRIAGLEQGESARIANPESARPVWD